MHGSNTRYGRPIASGSTKGMTGLPSIFSQFSSRGSLATATMLPAFVPWYMATTRSSSTSVEPL